MGFKFLSGREEGISFESYPIAGRVKRIRKTWSPELAQDLSAYHNIEAEVELTRILSEHLANEIDRAVLEEVMKEEKKFKFLKY